MLLPSPVIESGPPFIELSMAANKLVRSVLCINGVTSERHFDKTCLAFMAFIRGYFCLAIDLITKYHECSYLFYLSLYLFSSFCGDLSGSDPIYLVYISTIRFDYKMAKVRWPFHSLLMKSNIETRITGVSYSD
jgi:hypothetical protein